MINPFKEINWKPGESELRKFAWSLIIGFPSLALIFFNAKWIKTGALPEVSFFIKLAVIGALVGLVCLLLKPLARPLYVVWYALACCIGIVMANLLFMLMFYGLFTPIGLFMRLIGRDALKLKFQRGTPSYWQDAEPAPPPAQYFRQY
jgi:hypothetical protein